MALPSFWGANKLKRMKQGLLIWNVILTLVAGYLLISQFKSTKNGTAGPRAASGDSTATSKDFRIAYFDMDSIEANYDRVKDVKSELNKMEESINVEMDKLGREYQQRFNYYQNQAQSHGLSPEQEQAAAAELNNKKEAINARKQQLDQQYQELYTRINKEMKSAIEDYLKEFNKTKAYSYIFANESGLFYYRDSTYNITNEVVRGLNISYRKKNIK
jgi:outer membrane protein